MTCFSPSWILRGFLSLTLLGAATWVQAQDNSRKEYPLVAKVNPSGEELSAQPRLWIMEVHFKPMRMIEVALTNPETGKKQQENIWYMVYKVINRPLPYQVDMTDTAPANDTDIEPLPPMFAPIFTLRTDDITDGKPVQDVYMDVILPEAQAAINRREGSVSKKITYKNSVEIMQEVPTATPADQGDENALYGVVMWRGVDRDTDFFTVTMTGFSNGYRYVNGPVKFDKLRELARSGEITPADAVWDGAQDIRTASEICNWKESIKAQTDVRREWQSAGSVGGLFDDVKAPPADALERVWFYTKTADRYPRDQRPPVWRRAIVQHYSRFGDRFGESEKEFRSCLDPHWIYAPDNNANAAVIPKAAPADPAAPATPPTVDPTAPAAPATPPAATPDQNN